MEAEQDGVEGVAHWTITVTGRVQGVNYRAGAREQARALGLAGEARNMPDGSVQIEVEGPVAALARFRAWCAQGPAGADVTETTVAEGPLHNYPAGAFHRR